MHTIPKIHRPEGIFVYTASNITILYSVMVTARDFCALSVFSDLFAVTGCSSRHGHSNGLCEQDERLHGGQVLRGRSLKGRSLLCVLVFGRCVTVKVRFRDVFGRCVIPCRYAFVKYCTDQNLRCVT